jgi:hypothetical protein
MAAAIWYVTKDDADSPSCSLIDGVAGCFVNDDDLTSAADVRTAAEAALGLPAGYFNSAVLALGVGGLDTDGDVVTFGRAETRIIA